MASRPISIKIIGDDSQLKKTLKGASKKLEGFGKSVAKFGITAGAVFGATAAAAATKGITAFADFDKSLREVMTLLPDAGDTVFGELSDQVKNFSKEFGVLPDKVIPSLYQAISAGVPRENVFEFLEVAQKAAKGGVTDLETAVDGISSVVNAYGSDVISATEASDLMFTAVKLGKTDFNQLSTELFKVAPIAASVGIEFGAITASLANLTAKGVPTAQAATQLKAAMAELAKEGTKADKAFRDFSGEGLTDFLANGGTFEEALIMMKEGADNAQVSVMDLFGSIEASQAVLALTSDGGDTLTATMGEMAASAGATQTAFETMDTGLAASFDKIKANLSVMAIETGERLAPHVLRATELLMEGFEKASPFIQRAREAIQDFAKAVIERAIPIFHRLKDVAIMVAGWIAGTMIPALVSAFHKVKEVALLVVAWIRNVMVPALITGFHKFLEVAKMVIEWIKTNLFPIAIMVAGALVTAFNTVREAIIKAFNWMMEHKDAMIVLGGALAGLITGFLLYKGVMLVVTKVTKVFFAVQKALQILMALNPIMVVVAALFALIGALVAAYYRFESVREIVDGVFEKMSQWGEWVWGWLKPAIEKTVGAIILAFWAVLTFFKKDFIPITMKIVGALVTAWKAFADFFMKYVYPIIEAAFHGVVSVIKNFWDVIYRAYRLVKSLFQGDFEEVWYQFRHLVWQVVEFIVDLFIALPIRILSAAKGLLDVFSSIVGDFGKYLIDKIKDLILAMPSWIFDFFKGIAKDIINLGKDIGGHIISGIVAAIKAAAGAVADAVKSIIPNPADIVGGVVGSVGGFFKSVIPGLAEGGIVTKPTLAVVGEAGAEAVIPLNKAGSLGGTTINLTVNAGMGTDGAEVGQAIVESLQAWSRQNGSIPIATVSQ